MIRLLVALRMSPQPAQQPMVVCSDCGTANEASRRKCRHCGAFL